ncbi:hypothetical protein [Nocardia sp. NPDC049707]
MPIDRSGTPATGAPALSGDVLVGGVTAEFADMSDEITGNCY